MRCGTGSNRHRTVFLSFSDFLTCFVNCAIFSPMKKFQRITVNPEVLSGQACIRNLRIPVHQILDLLAAGKTPAQILEDYPYLELEDITEAIEYTNG